MHALTANDAATVAALRAVLEPHRGEPQGTAAREPFDTIMERVVAAEGLTYESGSVNGVSGGWVRPTDARSGEAMLYLHGGWFNWGSARAYRNFVGHLATRVGAAAFVPDDRLAPERPFPAAVVDAEAAYRGLVEGGAAKIAIVGDSAGGALALVLLSGGERLRQLLDRRNNPRPAFGFFLAPTLAVIAPEGEGLGEYPAHDQTAD